MKICEPATTKLLALISSFILILMIYLNVPRSERIFIRKAVNDERITRSQTETSGKPILTVVELNDTQRIAYECYKKTNIGEDIDLLDDVLESEIKPQLGKSIFFHETSCGNRIVNINARQACAVESAAKANPQSEVFLLFASAVGFPKNKTKLSIVQALMSYPNIHLRNLNMWSYAQDTPSSKFLNTKKLFRSKYLVSHTSDFLRYLSLFKWGGTYLDLDVVVKQNFDSVKPNFAGAESLDLVAAGVINVDYDGFGHEIAAKCLKDLTENFDGDNWGNNGPGVITRVLKEICESKHTNMMSSDHCHGFRVLNVDSLYAIEYWHWDYFFDEKYTDQVLAMINNNFVVHVWNKLSSTKPVRVGSNVAYGVLASKYCPKVYASCGEYF